MKKEYIKPSINRILIEDKVNVSMLDRTAKNDQYACMDVGANNACACDDQQTCSDGMLAIGADTANDRCVIPAVDPSLYPNQSILCDSSETTLGPGCSAS